MGRGPINERVGETANKCVTDESLSATIEPSIASPCYKILALVPEHFQETSPSFRRVSKRAALTGYFLPSLKEPTSSTNSAFPPRSNGFVAMLTPLQENLRPKDLKSSPFLCGISKTSPILRISANHRLIELYAVFRQKSLG